MVGQRSKVSGRTLTPMMAYTTVLAAIPAMGIGASTFMPTWMFALQSAAVMASEKIERTIELVERCSPADPEWKCEVVPAIKHLAHETLPCLSEAFGNGLGVMVISFWTMGLGFFSKFLSDRLPLQCLWMLMSTFFPFLLASTVSGTSDECDRLRDSINAKRFEELDSISEATALQLTQVEKALRGLNRGQ